MLDYAEDTFINEHNDTLRIHIYETDEPFQALVRQRGYRRDAEHPGYDSELVIGNLPGPNLPPGYVIRSMAQESDLAARCKIRRTFA